MRPADDGYWRGSFEAMAGPCEVLCEVASAAEARSLTEIAATEAWRVQDKFSRYCAGNIVERINSAAGAGIEVDAETTQLIEFSETLYELSEGRFDITSGALRRVWQFGVSGIVPAAEEVEKALRHVGWHRVRWNPPALTMPAGMEVDFGGIGKEYAVDRAARHLTEATSGSCLVNFGGDLAVTRPPQGRRGWTVGIEPVDATNDGPGHRLELAAGALATSGDTHRFVERDGRRYGHILDPRSGWPIVNAPRSVTVAAPTCVQAGMLSTLGMLAGEDAEAFLAAQGAEWWCSRGRGLGTEVRKRPAILNALKNAQ